VKAPGAHWYSIKPLESDIPSLADLLGVSAENLQTLLVKFGLGNLGTDNKLFSFQASKFDSFRSAFSIQKSCSRNIDSALVGAAIDSIVREL
jgi:hypothetical protein